MCISTRTMAGSGARRMAGSTPTTGVPPMISIASVQAATPPTGASTIRIGVAPSMTIALVVSEPIAATVASASAAVPAADAAEPERAAEEGEGHA